MEVEHRFVAPCPTMNERDFSQIEQDLDEAFSSLKRTSDPMVRRDLLLRMSHLLREADSILFQVPEYQ
jgi:hypothetical protein